MPRPRQLLRQRSGAGLLHEQLQFAALLLSKGQRAPHPAHQTRSRPRAHVVPDKYDTAALRLVWWFQATTRQTAGDSAHTHAQALPMPPQAGLRHEPVIMTSLTTLRGAPRPQSHSTPAVLALGALVAEAPHAVGLLGSSYRYTCGMRQRNSQVGKGHGRFTLVRRWRSAHGAGVTHPVSQLGKSAPVLHSRCAYRFNKHGLQQGVLPTCMLLCDTAARLWRYVHTKGPPQKPALSWQASGNPPALCGSSAPCSCTCARRTPPAALEEIGCGV